MNNMYQFYEKYVKSFNIFEKNLEDNFIIFYSSNFNNDYKLCNAIKNNEEFNEMKLYKIIYPDQKNIETNLYEQIYVDDYLENILIYRAKFIIYLLDTRSINDNFIEFIKNNNKTIIYDIRQLNSDINLVTDFEKKYYLLKTYIRSNSSLKNNILFDIKKIEKKRIKFEESYINYVTYFKYFDNIDDNDKENLYKTQIITICENFKNKFFKRFIIIGDDLDRLKTDLTRINNSKNLNKEIIFIENFKDIIFGKIIELLNNNYPDQINILSKSDVIIPYQDNFDNLEYFYNNNNNVFFCISTLLRLNNGNLIKNNNYIKKHCSTEQDIFMFKTPVNCQDIDLDIFNKYDELFINYELLKRNFTIINDTSSYKIIRYMSDDKEIDNRIIYNNNTVELENIKDMKENIYFLPENEYINNINININMNTNMTYIECYQFKCNFINKIIKENILK
jgi:hypothetical protein